MVASSLSEDDDASSRKLIDRANIKSERPGSDRYQQNHMALIFQQGLSFSGYERDLGVEMFDVISRFADYAFTKSHAYGYGLIAHNCVSEIFATLHAALESSGRAGAISATVGSCG